MTEKSKRIIKTFAWASFLNDFGSDMIYPVWPLFVTSFLGVDMTVLGLLDGLGDALVSVSQAVSGYLSDKYRKRKIFIWTGYLCGSLSRIGYALAPTWHWLVPFKILDRAGKMRGAPRDAMIADASTDKDRGTNFGFLRAMDNTGAFMGVITTLVLFSWLGMQFKEIFLIAAMPSLVSVALIISRIRENQGKNVFKGIQLKSFTRNYKVFLALNTVFAIASFSYSFFIVHASELGVAIASVPVFYLLFTVIASASSIPFGQLSDKWGRKPVLAASYVLFAGACACALTHSAFMLIPLFLLYGLHLGAFQTVQKAFVAELSPLKYRASGLGTFQLVTGLAALPASLLAGFLWESFGAWAPFSLSAVLAVVAAFMLALVKN